MTTILPASTAPVPGYLAPDFRYAGDDWTGSNALLYVVWSVAPTVVNGVVTVAGTPRDLTGCTVSGLLRFNAIIPWGGANSAASGFVVSGAIVGDPTQGEIALSLPRAQTGFAPQNFSAWGDPSRAGFIAQPTVTGSDGALVSIGLQPLFVF